MRRIRTLFAVSILTTVLVLGFLAGGICADYEPIKLNVFKSSTNATGVITATTTSDAIPLWRPRAGYKARGTAFSIQVYRTGAEANTRLLTLTYETTNDDVNFGTPGGASDICTTVDCDGVAAGVIDTYGFSPEGCAQLKIKATLDAALTNGITAWLVVY